VSRPTAAFRQARRCYGHLAGTAGVALREQLEVAGFIRQEGAAYRLTDAGRRWAESFGFDTDDRDLAKYARCCLDGTEKQWHVGGRLGVAILAHLLALGVLWLGQGRELEGAEPENFRAALKLP
jgi:hypothetical protein